jgi:hypothetical protein
MLDVHEYDSLINDSARTAALAVVTDTTARAIQAVIQGRGNQLGRRTMFAVSELVQALTNLRDQAPVQPDDSGASEIFKNEDITSGVGRLIGEEQSSGLDSHGWSTLLGLSKVMTIDSEGQLVVDDADKGRQLANLLLTVGEVLTKRSAQTYAQSRSSYRG